MTVDARVSSLEQKIARLERQMALMARGGVRLPVYTMTNLPKSVEPGHVILVPDATAGTVLAVSDGANWLELCPVGVIS